MSDEKCGSCKYFHPVPGSQDLCYGNPPTIFNSGVQYRPHVKERDFACHIYQPIPEGSKPEAKAKTQPDTVGDAAKLRRQTGKVLLPTNGH